MADPIIPESRRERDDVLVALREAGVPVDEYRRRMTPEVFAVWSKFVGVIEAPPGFDVVAATEYLAAAPLAVNPPDEGLADRELADALLNWYDTTHGNEFGHDHHCPIPWNDRSPHQLEPNDRCTCGWTGVLKAEIARVARRDNKEKG
jgi:hypothetical protein